MIDEKNLSMILFGLGLLLLLIFAILFLKRAAQKKNPITPKAVSLAFMSLICMVAGLFILLLGTKDKSVLSNKEQVKAEKTVQKQDSSTNGKEKKKNSSKVIEKFDPTGSVAPKTFEYDGYKVFEDADGTLTKVSGDFTVVMVTPEGIRARLDATDETYVEFPVKSKEKDGLLHYEHYGYTKSTLDGTIYATKGIIKYRNKLDHYPVDPRPNIYTEMFAPNSDADIPYIDFIFEKHFPLKKPKQTVENRLLIGYWEYQEENLMTTETWMKMDFSKDGFLTIATPLIKGLPDLLHYKVEPLGKNAYKLYLYPVAVNAEDNGGGTFISQEPLKRTFLIYMKNESSFELVFFDDRLSRRSFLMKKIK